MGTNFSPRVPEASLMGQGVSLGSPDLWGLPSPYVSPWESLGDMYSPWGPWERVSLPTQALGEPVFLPGFLGAFKTSQSWANSSQGRGLSLKRPRRDVSGPPPVSPMGVSLPCSTLG